MDLEQLRARFTTERPTYEHLAQQAQALLEAELRRRSVLCSVTSRAKEVGSFLKKALRSKYADPYEQIGDKAGARVTVIYEDSVPIVESVVRGLFDVLEYENKKLGLGAGELGYLGIHFDVALPEQHLQEPAHSGLRCEIQIHTRAQNLWADVSHELDYKAPQDTPDEVRRRIYRLMALVELFDDQVAAARREILAQPGFQEAKILACLEEQFLALTGKQFDHRLSHRVIELLEPLLGTSAHGYCRSMEDFVRHNRDKLQGIFSDYLDDDRHIFLSQPESLLIFERLEADKFLLTDAWEAELPLPALEAMAAVWGTSL